MIGSTGFQRMLISVALMSLMSGAGMFGCGGEPSPEPDVVETVEDSVTLDVADAVVDASTREVVDALDDVSLSDGLDAVDDSVVIEVAVADAVSDVSAMDVADGLDEIPVADDADVGDVFEFDAVDALEDAVASDGIDTTDLVDVPCVPDCSELECGLDAVCGESCGTCDDGYLCQDGQCIQDPLAGMVLIPEGPFWMGCDSADFLWCSPGSSPYHEVTLSGYYMDKTEVTQGAYKQCVDAGQCDTPRCDWNPGSTPDRPVGCANWTQAVEYCAWAGKRLPTEAEWEKAARGTDGRIYPWGNETATCEYAVMSVASTGLDGCGTGSTWEVCSKSPAGDSPYGLCDMSGNVWEWVSDWWDLGYYTNSPASNPTGPDSGSIRVLRGGSFYMDGEATQIVYVRGYDYPSGESGYQGFRCARSQ